MIRIGTRSLSPVTLGEFAMKHTRDLVVGSVGELALLPLASFMVFEFRYPGHG